MKVRTDYDIRQSQRVLSFIGNIKLIFGIIAFVVAFLYFFPAINIGLYKLPVDRGLNYSTMGLHIAASALLDLFAAYLFKTAHKKQTNCNILIILMGVELLKSIIVFINNGLTMNCIISLVINFFILYSVLRVRSNLVSK